MKFNVNEDFFSSGIDFRIDQDYVNDNNWSIISNDIIGYTDLSRNTKNGWTKDLTYKKRIKSSDINFNYSLLDLKVSWRNPKESTNLFH